MVVALFGEKTPKELGFGTFRKSERPILSATVDRVVTIPYMNGAYDFGADMGPKQFNLECAFIARNHLELQQRISAFAAYLLDGNGRPRTMPLIFANEPDKQYMVRLSGSLPIDRIYGLGVFMLPLVANDPFAYSVYDLNDINVDSPISVDSDIIVDSGFDYPITGATTILFSNYGTLNMAPIIEIVGSFTTLSLTIGGIEFTYNSPISGTLMIDFVKKTAKIGATNVLMNTNRKFGTFPVGESNILIGGTGLNCTLTIHFNAKYA